MIPASAILLFAQVQAGDITIAADQWKLIQRQSGPVNYYTVVREGGVSFLRSNYVPPMKTAVMGWQTPEEDRRKIKRVRWTWRVLELPAGGDECTPSKADSAAVVYLTWKSGLRYYTLKYVWSSVGKKNRVCDSKRTPFVAQDTVILESGGPLRMWKTAEIDLAKSFRHHFEGGDPKAEVPDFVGIGLMSDGDQTNSRSSADFGTFTLVR